MASIPNSINIHNANLTSAVSLQSVPEDAINLDDGPFIVDADLYSTNTRISMKVLMNMRDSAMDIEYESVLGIYNAWKSECLSELENSLQGYFPDRWEIVMLDPPSGSIKAQLCRELVRCKGDMNVFDCSNTTLRGLCKVTVHFPEILISNSSGTTWTIKDFYVIMTLGQRLELSDINGYRATKSYREYKLGYNHSHSRCAPNGITSFCFGSTPLDTLIGELKFAPFNGPRIDLLLQNLVDYLSWESLEGHPYKSIDEIVSINLGRSEMIDLGAITLRAIIRNIHLGRPDILVNIANDSAQVMRSMHLVRALTPHVPENYRYKIDEVSLSSVYPFRTNVAEIKLLIKNINSSEGSKTVFWFKGKSVHLTVEDIEEEEEPREMVEKFADMRIVDAFISTTQSGLTQHLHDRFWYGTKERSVQQA